MGLFSRKYRNPARGTAVVASATVCPPDATSATCRMNLVVSLPGMPATPTRLTAMVRASKWPYPGTTLPIEIDLDKPSRMRILWDEVPSGRARGEAAAQQIAAQLNAASAGIQPGMQSGAQPGMQAGPQQPVQQGLGGLPIPPGAQVISSSVTINGQTASPEQIAAMESLTGMDLNGDGVVGPPPAR